METQVLITLDNEELETLHKLGYLEVEDLENEDCVYDAIHSLLSDLRKNMSK